MRRSILSSVTAACLVLAASYARADNVVIDAFAFVPPTTINVSSVAPGTAVAYADLQAGQFTGTLNGASFLTYCTELTQSFNFGQTYTDYSVVDGVAAWGATASLQLDKLMTAAIQASYPTDSDTSALIQASIWEILYETVGGTHSFTSGTFTASSNVASTQNVLTNGINWSALDGSPVAYHVSQLHSETGQDFMVITAVPEPSTYALMFAGLVGIGFVARRRAPR